jgi:hypothetical protein
MAAAPFTPPLFIPEGHIDKALMRALLGYRKDFENFVSRKQGASGVATAMVSQWDSFGPKRRVVGMVDADKRFSDVRYLTEFSREIMAYHADCASYTIRQHLDRPSQYLIVLHPACDTWVWQAAVLANLDLAAYRLPTERREFVSYSKARGKNVGDDSAMVQVLREVHRLQPDLFKTLARFIKDVMHLAGPLP